MERFLILLGLVEELPDASEVLSWYVRHLCGILSFYLCILVDLLMDPTSRLLYPHSRPQVALTLRE